MKTNKKLLERAYCYLDRVPVSDVVIKGLIKSAYIAGATEETKLLSEHILELQKTNGSLTDRLNELEKENESLASIKNFQIGDLLKAKEIIKSLIGTVRELNNPNVQLTDVNGYLAEAEQFLGEEK